MTDEREYLRQEKEYLANKAQLILDLAVAEDRDLEVKEECDFTIIHTAIVEINATLRRLEKQTVALDITVAKQMSLFPKQQTGVKTYFVWDGEFVKIGGTSASELNRKKQFQTGNVRELVVLATIPGAQERKVRALFTAHHVRGEWFRMCPEIDSFVRAWQVIESVL